MRVVGPLLALLLAATAVGARPNFIVVLTDDQRFDDLVAMPTLDSLRPTSVDFKNAFVTTCECAPTRASLLSGQYAHHHGVRTLNGTVFPDASTLPVWLKTRRYRTALVGKYLNGYAAMGPPYRSAWYVPPGWDYWRALRDEAYYDYGVVDEGGGVTTFGSDEASYSTDVLRDYAVGFLREALAARRSFFLLFTPFAPHVAARDLLYPIPALRHAGLLLDTPPLRPPSFMEPDISDKPMEQYIWWLGAEFLDGNRIVRLQSLLAVDEALAAFLDVLAEFDAERKTVIIFLSDNGFLLGEHRLFAKPHPYEEAHRTPLLIRDPRHVRAERTDDHLVLVEDVPATIAQLAGARTPAIDGTSLRNILRNRPLRTWRQALPLEEWFDNGSIYFRGVRTTQWSYVERYTEEKELYDLDSDPYQLQNLANDSAYGAIVGELHDLTVGLRAGD